MTISKNEDSPTEWEKQKHREDYELKVKEYELSKRQLKSENFRTLMIGVTVPITLAIITGVPALIQAYQDRQIEEQRTTAEQLKSAFEAESAHLIGIRLISQLLLGSNMPDDVDEETQQFLGETMMRYIEVLEDERMTKEELRSLEIRRAELELEKLEAEIEIIRNK